MLGRYWTLLDIRTVDTAFDWLIENLGTTKYNSAFMRENLWREILRQNLRTNHHNIPSFIPDEE